MTNSASALQNLFQPDLSRALNTMQAVAFFDPFRALQGMNLIMLSF
jgi:hypothetical protein